MAGWLYFGGEDGVSLGSSAIDFIASYLRPYITEVSTEVMQKVYETYDLFDDTLDFSALSSQDYMHCYSQLLKSFETDLAAIPIINGKSRQWAIDIWYDEIKTKMQASPLYNPNLLNKKRNPGLCVRSLLTDVNQNIRSCAKNINLRTDHACCAL